MQIRGRNSFPLALSFLLLGGCAKNTMSERDTRLTQQRAEAEQKRKELQLVVGEYAGAFRQPGWEHQIVLKIEIKEVPVTVDGKVDPILVPTLAGYMQFVFGQSTTTTEYISFALQKAEFDQKRNALNLFMNNAEYKDVSINLVLIGNELKGKWLAPDFNVSGDASLRRTDSVITSPTIRGTYRGQIQNTNPQSQLPNRIQLSLVASQDPAQASSIKVSGSMRLYYGDFEGQEYTELPFEIVHYNIYTRQLLAKTQGDIKLTIKAQLSGNEIKGVISENALGELGEMGASKI